MKKSKIIVPALAMIGLSAVASVTGSVAWFTAQRTGNITTGEFAVVKADGNLAIEIKTAGIGTQKAAGDHPTTVNPKEGAKSVDVSFNPSSKQLWTDNDDGVGSSFVSLDTNNDYANAESASNHYVVSTSDKVYQAFSWEVQVSYTWGADFTQQNIFFDYSDPAGTGSKMTGKDSSGNTIAEPGINNSCRGFRIAIIGSTQTIVFADLQAAASLKTVTATNSTSAYTGLSGDYSYFASDKFGKGGSEGALKNTYEKANNNTASQTSRADYVGSITHTAEAESDTLTFWCVAWYEGTDPSINNNAALEKVATKLSFYAATNKAA